MLGSRFAGQLHDPAGSRAAPLILPVVDFEVGHRFAVTAGELAAAMLDQDYQRSLFDIPPLQSRELLVQAPQSDGTVVRRVRCVLGIELPGAARNFLGGSEPAWVEEATWHPESLRWDWVILPEVAQDLLSSHGSIQIEPSGDKTERWVRGRVSVKVAMFGGRIERVVVDGIRRAYEEEAQRLGAWLQR
jgi:hypothetical protein